MSVLPPPPVSRASARRRMPRWALVVTIVLVVLAVLWAVAEVLLRTVGMGIVKEKVVAGLHLPDGHPVTVDAPGLLVPQLITGGVADVRVATDGVTFGKLTGDLDVQVDRFGMDGSMRGAKADFTLSPEQFRRLLPDDRIPIESFAMDRGDVAIGSSATVFGVAVPLSVTLRPAVDEGDLTLAPVGFSVGGAQVDAQALARKLGEQAERFVAPWRVCLRNALPSGIALEDVSGRGSRLSVSVTLSPDFLTDPAQREPGRCG